MEISSPYSKSFPTLNYKIEYYVLKTSIDNTFKSKENNQNKNDEHDCTIWAETEKKQV